MNPMVVIRNLRSLLAFAAFMSVLALSQAASAQTAGGQNAIESFSVAAMVRAADAMIKAASVTLLDLRLAMALGGKAFCSLTGDVASVEAAVAAGRVALSEEGVLVNAVVIARPHPDVCREVV